MKTDNSMVTTQAPATHARLLPLQRKCSCGASAGMSGECAECQEEHLQRRAVGGVAEAREIPQIVSEVLQSPGEPLDAGTRGYFEQTLGHDFSDVRVHTDAHAARSAQSVHAQAYTVGKDVVFGPSQYSPGSQSGRRLLAHELTHVAQQRQASGELESGVGATDTPEERQAEAAERLVEGGPAFEGGSHSADDKRSAGIPYSPAAPAALQRKPVDAASGAKSKGEPCPPDWLSKAGDAFTRVRHWLDYEVLPSLEWYLRFVPGRPEAETRNFRTDIRSSLARHFGIAKPDSAEARQLLANLKSISQVVAEVSIHCAGEAGCGGRNAEHDADTKTINLCKPFFDETDPLRRARTIVHELSHGNAFGGKENPHPARDLADPLQRRYGALSTADKLNNAESYASFVYEVANGVAEPVREARDTVLQCGPGFPSDAHLQIRAALAEAEFWNTNALGATSVSGRKDLDLVEPIRARYFGKKAHPTLAEMRDFVYLPANRALRRDLKFECAADCGAGVFGYFSRFAFGEATLHLCPTWFAEADLSRRAALLYRLLLQREASSFEDRDLVAFVEFARDAVPHVSGERRR